MKLKRTVLLLIPVVLVIVLVICSAASDCFAAEELKPYIDSVENAQKGMSLWKMLQTGGFIMVVLALISVAAIALIVYNFIALKVDEIAPRNFAEEVVQKLERGESVNNLCEANDNIIASIVLAGLRRKGKGPGFAREAMENREREEIGNLWQNIGYLADIATVAPLIGLLGTVLGMIQAFNVIAFQTAVVKPILLAGGVSKAMVTTAGGLILAIPAMLFYAFFKGKVQEISNIVEAYRPDLVKVIEQSEGM